MNHIWRASTFINFRIPYKPRKAVALNCTLLCPNRKRNHITVELALSTIEIPAPVVCTITLIHAFSRI